MKLAGMRGFWHLLLFLAVSWPAAAFERWPVIHFHFQELTQKLSAWDERRLAHIELLRHDDDPRLARWRLQFSSFPRDGDLSLRQIEILNAVINGDVAYVDDYEHYHVDDYWADPVQALEEGGDCEDIALVKAATLAELGWPPERMHLLVGYLTENGRRDPHAVLVVDTEPSVHVTRHYVLRSITDDVTPIEEMPLDPVYALDAEGALIFVDSEEARRAQRSGAGR